MNQNGMSQQRPQKNYINNQPQRETLKSAGVGAQEFRGNSQTAAPAQQNQMTSKPA